MKKSGLVLSLAAATTLTGVVLPSTAQAAPSSSANPSCAALWAHFQQYGFVPNLGQAQKEIGKGFAKMIAQNKVNDGYCYDLGDE